MLCEALRLVIQVPVLYHPHCITPIASPHCVLRGIINLQSSLQNLLDSIAIGDISLVDLTHSLRPDFPTLALPPEYGQVAPFKLETISCYDSRGPAWYWNNFSCGEHTGTHLDAPSHWVTGKDLPGNTVDTLDCKKFIAPASVVDASREVANDPDWILSVEFLRSWEHSHGTIPRGAWLVFRTDWSKRISSPSDFLNIKSDGAHTPGPSQAAVEWLIHEREILGFAAETINTDAGQSYRWPLPYPCHTLMHGANRLGLQCLNNVDQLPPTGSVIIAAPLKIQGGSGSPLRAFALTPVRTSY